MNLSDETRKLVQEGIDAAKNRDFGETPNFLQDSQETKTLRLLVWFTNREDLELALDKAKQEVLAEYKIMGDRANSLSNVCEFDVYNGQFYVDDMYRHSE